MKTASIVVLILSLSVVFAAGEAKEGKAVYDRSCKNCHGENGMANPKIEKMMNVKIAPLSSPDVQKMTDAELEKIITAGKGKMPAVHSVTGKSVGDVVAYVRTLKAKK